MHIVPYKAIKDFYDEAIETDCYFDDKGKIKDNFTIVFTLIEKDDFVINAGVYNTKFYGTYEKIKDDYKFKTREDLKNFNKELYDNLCTEFIQKYKELYINNKIKNISKDF